MLKIWLVLIAMAPLGFCQLGFHHQQGLETAADDSQWWKQTVASLDEKKDAGDSYSSRYEGLVGVNDVEQD